MGNNQQDANIREMTSLLFDNELEKYNTYRKSIVPKKLFKFMCFDHREDLNKSKIECIENNRFWLSEKEWVNDPFELESHYLDYNKIKKYNRSEKEIEQINRIYTDEFLLGCFTTENNLNICLPMWAHYADNHKGFCIEYEVLRTDMYYPVSYEPNRFPMTTIFMDLLTLMNIDTCGKITDAEKEKLQCYHELAYYSNMVKHESWSYENEWRILYPKNYYKELYKKDINGGAKVFLEHIGLKISSIYFGMSYDKNNEFIVELKKICKDKGVDMYKMYIDFYQDEYKLSCKEL